MQRKAVLIESSDTKGQRDLPGARVDVENWDNFLRSMLGGSWSSSEIVTLRKPSSSQLASCLTVESDCYTFVAFSGHGEDGSVVLNDYEQSVSLTKLKPKSSRGVVIVDSCRGVSSGRYNFSANSVAIANRAEGSKIALNASESRTTSLKTAQTLTEAYTAVSLRSKWDSAAAILTGVVEMLACAKGQGAEEDASAGGYYTSLLMASADEWDKKSGTAKIFTTKNAHDYALANLPKQQTPEYSPTWLAYPFAIKT